MLTALHRPHRVERWQCAGDRKRRRRGEISPRQRNTTDCMRKAVLGHGIRCSPVARCPLPRRAGNVHVCAIHSQNMAYCCTICVVTCLLFSARLQSCVWRFQSDTHDASLSGHRYGGVRARACFVPVYAPCGPHMYWYVTK